MSIVGFSAQNHPQQTGKRGAKDEVDDRGTDQTFFDSLSQRFGGFGLDVAAAPHNTKCAPPPVRLLPPHLEQAMNDLESRALRLFASNHTDADPTILATTWETDQRLREFWIDQVEIVLGITHD